MDLKFWKKVRKDYSAAYYAKSRETYICKASDVFKAKWYNPISKLEIQDHARNFLKDENIPGHIVSCWHLFLRYDISVPKDSVRIRSKFLDYMVKKMKETT